jgi:Kef-type K+ transport system membrane component KefB
MNRIVGLVIVVVFMLLAVFTFGEATVFADARSTMTFGFLLLAAYLVGDFFSWFKLPKITGYIAAGILFGPYVLELISAATVRELKLIDDLALTFIALAAGGELRLKELRQRRRSITLTILFLTIIVFVGVSAFTLAARPLLPFVAHKSAAHLLAVAALLGTFAVARSPSSAIGIISECKSRGPFTETVLGVTVVMDVLVIIVFAAVVSICQAVVVQGGQMDFQFMFVMGIELVGSILGGIILGCVISLYIRYVKVELLVFILALAFMVSFFSRQFVFLLDRFYSISFHLEPMLICLTAGFLVQNFSRSGNVFMENIGRSSLPIYVIFFSLTGATLNLGALSQTWLIAVLLVAVRFVLIWLGAYLAASLSGDPPRFRRMSGLSFITQAGVSLGLAGIVIRRFPEWGAALATMIVAIISLNQIIGPIAFKFALNGVGEAGASARSQKSQLDPSNH